jgi:hypothetical protein
MNVAEFIEWLKTQDQEAIVAVLVDQAHLQTVFRDFEPDAHATHCNCGPAGTRLELGAIEFRPV